MAIVDRVNDIKAQIGNINDQIAALQNQAQPLRDRKVLLLGELSDLQKVVDNYTSFQTWKAAQP